MTLECADTNSKLVEVVSVAEDRVGNSLLQILELRLCHKEKFGSDFQHNAWSRFSFTSKGRLSFFSFFQIKISNKFTNK